ncbi:MAG: alanine--tRNA ligase [Phycisphaerales bacterium]|jgi:alanyl-tRNA synthetase
MLSAKQIRSGFIDFFKSKDHEFVHSSPIVPIGDDTLLFANAGMNQFKDIFLGLTPPQYPRVANTQKCLRVSGKHNDLEEVGKDTYHHTFFEMLGNWSFDDYFKAEAIQWAWELFTKVWGIDPTRLWATVFGGDRTDGLPEDEEAANLWTKVTPISPDRVLAYGKKDNFWEMGETGPCGPCSEIHIDLGADMCDMKSVPGHKCKVNAGCARFVELWNLVFIQFNRLPEGKLVPLSAKYVDTGAGLERVVAVLQNKKSNYDTDLFMPIIDSVSDITGHNYTSKLGNKTDNAFRVIADHVRSLVFAITDGATPSNEGRGYVIRRILRRASRFGRELGMHEPFIYKLVPVVVDCMGDTFGEIRERADYVSEVIKSEEASFGRTLDRGIEIFKGVAKKAEKQINKTISGKDAFQLYDTYGFPLDLTQLMARERGLKVDTDEFNILMDIQRELSRTAQEGDKLKQSLTGVELPNTDDNLKYETETCKAVIQGWVSEKGYSTEGTLSATNEPIGLVLDQTCFYAEAGGQEGDRGEIKSQRGEFKVEATEKIAECIIHQGKLVSGSFSVGDTVTITVDKRRQDTKKNHTATHLLQWALQQILGDTVHQQGSYVGPDSFRFDFTYPKALTNEEIKQVENKVHEKIEAALPVTCAVMPIDQAKKLGAMALFGEKYGNEVRVIAIGAKDKSQINNALSKEFCGGTHVNNTSEIICFKIEKEESVSAGVRRITGLTGYWLINYLWYFHTIVVERLSKLLNVQKTEIVHRVKYLIDKNKKLSKELKSASKASGSDVMAQAKQLLKDCKKIGDTHLIVGRLDNTRIEQAREAIDMLKKKAKSAAIVLGFDDNNKATLLAGMTNDLVEKGLSAGEVIKTIAPIIDGGGGGRPQMAQAGGKKPEKIDDALAKAREVVIAKLGG